MPLDQKGFTLFTALISFTLIAVAGILVASMMTTERSIIDTISAVDEQSEMQALADMARADSLQTFNFGVRLSLENWLVDNQVTRQNAFYILKDSVIEGKSEREAWDAIKNDFQSSELVSEQGNEQLVNQMTSHMVLLLQRGSVGTSKYRVCLVFSDGATCDTPAGEQSATPLRNNLKRIMLQSVNDPDHPFLEPIACDTQSCETGTFYLNFDFSRLTTEEFEQMPKIRVESLVTRRVIMEPVLPRGNVRIYVPLRVFLALRKSQEVAKKVLLAKNSARYATWGLGMCETDCSVRTDPFGTSTRLDRPDFSRACPGEQGAIDVVKFTDAPLSCENCPPTYDPNDTLSMSRILNETFSQNLCERVESGGAVRYPDDFFPQSDTCGGLEASDLTTASNKTKRIEHWLKGTNTQPRANVAQDGEAYCVTPTGMDLAITFREQNKQYQVNKARAENKYKVRLAVGLAPKNATLATCYSTYVQDTDTTVCQSTHP